MNAEPTLLQRAARQLGAGPLLDRFGIEPADWWEKQTRTASPRDPSEKQIGSMYMPAQTPIEPPGEVSAHSRYEIPLGPGFPELPVWPQETWTLRSFEVQLSGTMLTQDPLSFPKGTEELNVILALEQNGALVWSQNLSLPLLAVTGSEGREFTFASGVFVDLVNGLPYRADSQLRFVVSGLAPAFALIPEPLTRFEEESLEVARASLASEEEASQWAQLAAFAASAAAEGITEVGEGIDSVGEGIDSVGEGIDSVGEGIEGVAEEEATQTATLEEIRELLEEP